MEEKTLHNFNDPRPYNATQLYSDIHIRLIYSLHYFAYSKQFRFEGESHNFWELIYCDSGEAAITDEDTAFTLPQGYAFLHAPDHFHNVRPNDTYTNVTIVTFDGELDAIKSVEGKPIPLSAYDKNLLRVILSEGRQTFDAPLNIVYQDTLTLGTNPPVGALQMIKNHLECLLISMMRKVAIDQEESSPPKSQNYLEFLSGQIVSILEANLDSNIKLADIADKLGYSLTYIKKIFKATMGTSIIKYYIHLKIDRAKQLISESTYTISQISEMLGFESVQYFSRQFREITNMTPTAYLKSIRTTGIL